MSEKPELDFTLDDVAREAAKIEEAWRELKFGQNDPGYTSEEFAGAWGITVGAARKRLRRLRDADKLIMGKRTMKIEQEGVSPYYREVAVYLLKEGDESR